MVSESLPLANFDYVALGSELQKNNKKGGCLPLPSIHGHHHQGGGDGMDMSSQFKIMGGISPRKSH